MIKHIITEETSIKVNNSVEGETIETKIDRIVTNKEPITDGAPIIYTERKDGIIPAYDIRTDRFEVAIEAMDKVVKSDITKRDEMIKAKDIVEDKPIQTTDNQAIEKIS